jgi:hypothetical protein
MLAMNFTLLRFEIMSRAMHGSKRGAHHGQT